jgi:hypothetical protein
MTVKRAEQLRPYRDEAALLFVVPFPVPKHINIIQYSSSTLFIMGFPSFLYDGMEPLTSFPDVGL